MFKRDKATILPIHCSNQSGSTLQSVEDCERSLGWIPAAKKAETAPKDSGLVDVEKELEKIGSIVSHWLRHSTTSNACRRPDRLKVVFPDGRKKQM